MAACRVLDEPIRLTALDGQMGIEDVWDDGTDELVTRYGIGARGIEVISKIENGGSETFGFPLYDTHGNMLATLGRSGSSFTLGNEQSYDVWGSVRSGSSSEQQGYVANLGHRADPESFLTYMRARYYEPHTGRFISEDRAMDGLNWCIYADNSPTWRVDTTGMSSSVDTVGPAADLFKSWYKFITGSDDYPKSVEALAIIASVLAQLTLALNIADWGFLIANAAVGAAAASWSNPVEAGLFGMIAGISFFVGVFGLVSVLVILYSGVLNLVLLWQYEA